MHPGEDTCLWEEPHAGWNALQKVSMLLQNCFLDSCRSPLLGDVSDIFCNFTKKQQSDIHTHFPQWSVSCAGKKGNSLSFSFFLFLNLPLLFLTQVSLVTFHVCNAVRCQMKMCAVAPTYKQSYISPLSKMVGFIQLSRVTNPNFMPVIVTVC